MFCVSYVSEAESEVHTNSVVATESIIRQPAINPIIQKRWGLRAWSVWCWIERALCGRGWGASAIDE